MNLSEVKLIDLQTVSMKQDRTTIAMCEAIDPHLKQVAEESNKTLIYSRIDELESDLLDELAWQMNIDWYDANADIEIRRQLVKTANKVHKYRGTPFAVEEVISMYFGDGYVKEWFEYGGEPYMFKVYTSNSSVTAELAQQFIKVLNTVKNTRSHLEEIVITMFSELPIYISGFVHTGDHIELGQVM